MILFCFLFYYSRKLFKNLSNSMCFFIFRFFSVYIFLVCVCPFVFMYAKRKKFAVLLTSTLSIRRIKQQNNRVASPSRHFSSSTAAFSISFLILVLTLVLLFFFSLCSQTEMTFKWFSTEMHSNFIAAAYWFSLHLPLFLLHKQYHCVEFRERKKRSFLSLFFWPFRLLLWFSACARSCAFRHFNSCSLLK